MRQVLKAGAAYFGCVFGAGFVLGAVRVMYVVPHLGPRAAELIEMPIMFAVIVFAARTLARRGLMPVARSGRLAAGLLALAFMLLAEVALVLWLSPVPLRVYFARRDPVSGTAYLAMLGVFTVMPLVLGARADGESR